jgi:hypothetical protein
MLQKNVVIMVLSEFDLRKKKVISNIVSLIFRANT